MAYIVDIQHNETARLNALRDLKLLDTPPSEAFDRLTRMASRLLDAPVSTISLTDGDRQWFKSRYGVDLTEIPREQAPCSYAIKGSDVFVVPDLLADPRFADSPLAQAGIRFYAGAPLFTRSGFGLGTLCVVDATPRNIDEDGRRVLRDLADMVISQIELQNLIGRLDPSTGAPNQHAFMEDIEAAAFRSPGDTASAIFFEMMDAERASYLDRVVGMSSGERVMRQAIAVMQRQAGNSARVYQVGALRGTVLFDGSLRDRGADHLAFMLDTLSEPIDCDGVPVTPDPVFGAYEFTLGDESPADTLRRLFVAGAAAREKGQIAWFDEPQEAHSKRRFMLVNDFREALEDEGQLSLVYQPRVDMKTGSWLAVEALIRWNHPMIGNVSPGEFIPLIEQTALARPLMDWVAASAFRQLRAWRLAGIDLHMSINASAFNLDEYDFAERLLAAAEAHGVDPSSVELEFTESGLMHDPERVAAQMETLRARGIRIAADDFGTGYSNIAYLQRLPVSVLKIDQSFVRDLVGSAKDRTLVHAMIGIAHELGYRVVAEGIETQEAYDLLVSWGCDEGQGYLMSHPVAPDLIAAACMDRQAA